LYNVATHRLIYADESLISYVAFTWMKFGEMPYRDIWAPQSYNPLMYVAYQLSYQLFGFNAFAIRMIAVVPGIVSVFLVYLIGRKLFGNKAGLVGSFIYAVYLPFTVELEHSYGTAQSFVNMLALTSLFFLLEGVNGEKKLKNDLLIALSGVFLLLTVSMKPYLSLMGIVALGIIAHSNGFKIRKLAKPSLILVGSFLGAFAIVLLYLYVNGMFPFWVQTFQVGISPVSTLPLEEKIGRFQEYLTRTLFIQMFAVATIIWGFIKRVKGALYLFFWSLIPTLTITIGAFTGGSLFSTFSPLVILSAVSVTWLLNQTVTKIRMRDVNVILTVAVLGLALLTANAYADFGYYANYMYSVNPEVDVQLSIGAAIANITQPTDKIFVTDTALAVLAQRQVITVGPIKAAGFYDDLMGYDYERYVGIPGYPEGIINNEMILQALETQKPKVIVSSNYDAFGMLDNIIWTGGQEQIYRPLGPYIMEHYSLSTTIEYNKTRWEIWSYNPGNFQPLNIFSDQISSVQVGNRNIQASFSFQNNSCNYSYNITAVSYLPGSQLSDLQINYVFPATKQAFVRRTVDFHENVNLANYKDISLWVKGDNSTNNLWVDLKDDTGIERGIAIRNLHFVGWKNLVVSIQDFAERDIDVTAIRQLRVSIDNNAENTGSGSVTLAHLGLIS
jgi:hypothetical protein